MQCNANKLVVLNIRLHHVHIILTARIRVQELESKNETLS